MSEQRVGLLFGHKEDRAPTLGRREGVAFITKQTLTSGTNQAAVTPTTSTVFLDTTCLEFLCRGDNEAF